MHIKGKPLKKIAAIVQGVIIIRSYRDFNRIIFSCIITLIETNNSLVLYVNHEINRKNHNNHGYIAYDTKIVIDIALVLLDESQFISIRVSTIC